jgi:cell fate regulator YaaT (PSP1 superfamily)
MSCCGESCSCGKNEQSVVKENRRLVQLPVEGTMLPTFDWSKGVDHLSVDVEHVEVRFKNGRKAFFRNVAGLELSKDDRVIVESDDGHDLGTVSLSGEAARKMFEPGDNDQSPLKRVIRKASGKDLEKWLNAKKGELGVLQEARKIANEKGLNLNIKYVEFRGDGRRVSIYYTGTESVDFIDLTRKYASAFRVNVELRQAN